MITRLKAPTVSDLETMAKLAYHGTMEEDGIHRGFHSAECETPEGKLECRATECMSRRNATDWFSFRYYLNGKVISKACLTSIMVG